MEIEYYLKLYNSFAEVLEVLTPAEARYAMALLTFREDFKL